MSAQARRRSQKHAATSYSRELGFAEIGDATGFANEAFEYLLGAPEIDDYLRSVLWGAKLRGEGIEEVLSMVQGAYASSKSAEAKQRLTGSRER